MTARPDSTTRQDRPVIRSGDLYESCGHHPVLCIGVDEAEGEVWGVSLVDGSQPHSCSLDHCGVRKLTPDEAWKLKLNGPSDPQVRGSVPEAQRWWR